MKRSTVDRGEEFDLAGVTRDVTVSGVCFQRFVDTDAATRAMERGGLTWHRSRPPATPEGCHS